MYISKIHLFILGYIFSISEVMSGVPCYIVQAGILSVNSTTTITQLATGIQREVNCNKILDDIPMTLIIDSSWNSDITSFCNSTSYSSLCHQYEPKNLDFSKLDLMNSLLIFFNGKYASDEEMKVRSKKEIPTLVCFRAKIKRLDKMIITKGKLLERKEAIDEIFKLAPAALALKVIISSSLSIARDEDNRTELYDHIIEKLMSIKDSDRTLELDKDIATFIFRNSLSGRFDDPLKLTFVKTLYQLAAKNNVQARINLEIIKNDGDSTLKAEAESLFNRLAQNEMTPIDVIDRSPPKCNEWSVSQLYEALTIKTTAVNSLTNFVKNKYGIELNKSTEHRRRSVRFHRDRYTRFFAEVEPTSDESTNNNWIDFVTGYVKSKGIQPELMKLRAENMYCRMKKLQSIEEIIKDRSSDNSKKKSIMQLIPYLAEHDKWELLKKLVINTNDDALFIDTIKILINLGTQDSAEILEMIYQKTSSNSVKLAVLEAFKTKGIDIKFNGEIVTHLIANKETGQSQEHLKILQIIISEKHQEQMLIEKNNHSLSTLATTDIDQFIAQVKTGMGQSDTMSYSVAELDSYIIQQNLNLDDVGVEIIVQKELLLKSQADPSLNSSDIVTRIEYLRAKQLNLKEGLYSSSIQLALLKLKEVPAGDSSLLEKTQAIISQVSAHDRGSSFSEVDDSEELLIAQITASIIKTAGSTVQELVSDDVKDVDRDVLVQVNQNIIIADKNIYSQTSDDIKPADDTDSVEPKKSLNVNNGVLGGITGNSNYGAIKFFPPNKNYSPGFVGEVSSESVNGNILDGGMAVDNKVVSGPLVGKPNQIIKKNMANKQINKASQKWGNSYKPSMGNSGLRKKNRVEEVAIKKQKTINNKASQSIKEIESEIDRLRKSNSELSSPYKINDTNYNYAIANNSNVIPSAQQTISNLRSSGSDSSSNVTESSKRGSSSVIKAKRASGSKASVEVKEISKDFLKNKEEQDNLKSLGLIFIKDVDPEIIIGKEYMTVLINDTKHQKIILKILATPEILTCQNVKFLETFFVTHLDKVKTTKRGASELLVQLGENSIRMTMPNRTKVKMMREKHCSKKLKHYTRQVATIDEDLNDLPEESIGPKKREKNKERSESSVLEKNN
jgi:hypothetical protein